MDRLSPLDASFLHVEDGVTHMHIGSCAIFSGPAPRYEEVVALIASKLPFLPRYRQKVRFVPANLGHPVWVDDPNFDIAYHVRHTALPPPGGEEELDQLVGRLMSQELDRSRPLWEGWVVEGLSDDRWAVISKVHHCMVDGISGTDMMAVLLDASPDAVTAPAAPWTPRPEPSSLRLATDAIAQLALSPARQLRLLTGAVRSPSAALSRLGEVVDGLRSWTRVATRTTPTSIDGTIGPHRRYAAARCRLDDAKAIRTAFGGSVNDVVLAAIAGAFRDVMLERGEPVDGIGLRTLVPVSLRRPGDSTPNNQVTAMVAELPVGNADPLGRLALVRQQMSALKESHQAEVAETAMSAAQFAPPLLLALGLRAASAALQRGPQHPVSTVTTNVPGPQQPLFALGRGMLEYLPYVPLGAGIRMGVAILSYNSHLTFGITGDYDTASDVHFMAERIEAAMNTLREHADLVTQSKSRKKRIAS